MSANERQDIGVLQLSFFLWETEDQSGERSCPGLHSQSGQSWEWNPNNPQTTALAPQFTADNQLTGTKEDNEGAGGGGEGNGRAQSGTGGQPVTNPVGSHRCIGPHHPI